MKPARSAEPEAGKVAAARALPTFAFTFMALLAFAANSLLCRLALVGAGSPGAATGIAGAEGASIDAASFTLLRLVSGAVMLLVILVVRGERPRGSWLSGMALFAYALPFSFAYLSLSVGTGALLAFGAVQATMILSGLRDGERPHRLEWAGLLLAIGGLVYLVSPGITAPSFEGACLMLTAGIAWGFYSLRGRSAVRPVAETAGNFLRTLPFALLASMAFLPWAHVTPRGMLLAEISGALTSGLGYVIWYAALRGLTATRAATVQLATPALAALGGVFLLGEAASWRLAIAGALILGGVTLALQGRYHPRT